MKIYSVTLILSIFLVSCSVKESNNSQIEHNQPQIELVKPFNWKEIVILPPGGDNINAGFQVLHFNNKNKHYTASADSIDFFKKYLKHVCKLQSDADVLRFASDAVTITDGAYLEMGVCTGKTINFIAALNPNKIIYGFDSFKGLPEEWIRKDKIFPAGTFACKNEYIPSVLHNVILYKGLFKDVLPKFKETVLKDKVIALLHMDADIYSSTKDVFDIIGNNIVPGTIIVFDELYNYPGYENHEWKAFQEFLNRTGFKVEFLAFNENHEQIAVRILDSNQKQKIKH